MEENLSAAEGEAADGVGTSEKGTLRVHTLPDAGHWLHVRTFPHLLLRTRALKWHNCMLLLAPCSI